MENRIGFSSKLEDSHVPPVRTYPLRDGLIHFYTETDVELELWLQRLIEIKS